MESDSSVEQGKLFVGGLSWDTKEDGLKFYFEKFGEVKEAKIMQEQVSGKPRGFGFVTFRDPSSVHEVLTSKPHVLDGKTIDPKPATLKPTGSQKVFVGGLPTNCTDDDLVAACSMYGKVTNVDIKGKGSEKPRGFAFVDFDIADSVDKICKDHYIFINDKKVEVKRAEPRKKGLNSHILTETQQGHSQVGTNFFSMGRGMAGSATNPYFYGFPNYSAYPAASGQYTGQYADYRSFGGQQAPMSSYPDTTAGYSQPRGSFGTAGTDQYSAATNYGGGYEHLGYSYPTETGGINYNSHAPTTQHRSGYTTYGRS